MDPVTRSLFDLALLGTLFGCRSEVARLRPVLLDLGVDQMRLDLICATLLHAAGRDADCIDVLEDGVLVQEPGHDMGRALLTAALRRTGRPEWRRVAEAILSTAIHPAARQMALQELSIA